MLCPGLRGRGVPMRLVGRMQAGGWLLSESARMLSGEAVKSSVDDLVFYELLSNMAHELGFRSFQKMPWICIFTPYPCII